MPAKKKAEPTPTEVEGFETEDYEGHESFTCLRSKCGFQTFNAEAADAHRTEHEAGDDDAVMREALSANLADNAQVTTEEEPDD